MRVKRLPFWSLHVELSSGVSLTTTRRLRRCNIQPSIVCVHGPFSFCSAVTIITADSNSGEDHIHACNRANTSMDALIGSCTLLVSGDIVEVVMCKISRQRKEGKQNVFASSQQCVNCQWLLSACVRESCGSADQHRAHEAKCNAQPTAQKRTHTHLKSFDPGKAVVRQANMSPTTQGASQHQEF